MKINRTTGLLLKLSALFILLPSTGFAQELERVIDKVSWRSEPIKIVKLKSKGKAIELGKKFSAENDWLNGLTATVRNASDKAIARIDIQLSFPRPGGGTSPETATYMAHMIYGLEPADLSGDQVPKLVLPGEDVEVKLLDVNVPLIKTDLDKLGYEKEIKHAQIMVKSVTFVDGSEWAGDEMLYPNPNNPKQKINPRFPLEIQVPKNSKSPPGQPELQLQPTGFRFLNRGLRRAHAQTQFDRRQIFRGKAWLFQLPETLPCDRIYVGDAAKACGPVDEGCSYREALFVDNPTMEMLWQVNARKEFGQTRCINPDGTLCSPTFHIVNARAPCNARVAGTCLAAADWLTYPSTGCITGLFFQGPCTRSSAFVSRCEEYDPESCACSGGGFMSPIVIDVDHSGFSMTDATGGVVFDMLNDGVPLAISWTAAGSTNALLVLDRNGNGTVDSGEELFGDITPQPASSAPNGFLALAEYDKYARGGDLNGRIDRHDSIFAQLRLWQDVNHNGISEPFELKPVANSLRAIDLDYRESRRIDPHGNQFRYRAKVYDVRGAHAGRWAWDVFLNVQ